jgi:hypothetical protein
MYGRYVWSVWSVCVCYIRISDSGEKRRGEGGVAGPTLAELSPELDLKFPPCALWSVGVCVGRGGGWLQAAKEQTWDSQNNNLFALGLLSTGFFISFWSASVGRAWSPKLVQICTIVSGKTSFLLHLRGHFCLCCSPNRGSEAEQKVQYQDKTGSSRLMWWMNLRANWKSPGSVPMGKRSIFLIESPS